MMRISIAHLLQDIEGNNPLDAMAALDTLERVAGLPDASGEFTGYFDNGSYEDYYNRVLGPGLGTIMVGPDACSPDVSQPYPF